MPEELTSLLLPSAYTFGKSFVQRFTRVTFHIHADSADYTGLHILMSRVKSVLAMDSQILDRTTIYDPTSCYAGCRTTHDFICPFP